MLCVLCVFCACVCVCCVCVCCAWEISVLNTYLLIFDSVVCVQDVFLRLFKDTNSGDSIDAGVGRSEEHTSELQSRVDLVCRLLLENCQQRRGDRKSVV